MARYYQTADREYLEDGIYMPPVELMTQVIANKDAQIDQLIDNLDVIQGQASTNIQYWDKADMANAQSLRDEYNKEINDITQSIMDHPLSSTKYQASTKDLQQKMLADMQQGGRIWNLAKNLDNYNKAVEAFSALKDKGYGQRQLNYIVNQYLSQHGSDPRTEANLFSPSDYLTPTENVDLAKESMDLIKERQPHTNSGESLHDNGTKTGSKSVILSKDEIGKLFDNDIANNLPPSWRAKMLTDDIIGENGGKKWFKYDENGNPIGIDTNGELWQHLKQQSQDFYYKNDRENTVSIWSEKLYAGSRGLNPKDENQRIRPAAFIANSGVSQQAFLQAAKEYQAKTGKPYLFSWGIRGKNGYTSYRLVTDDNGNYKIAEIDNKTNKVDKTRSITQDDWNAISSAFQQTRETPDSMWSGLADNFGKYFYSVAADDDDTANFISHINQNGSFNVSGSPSSSYNISNEEGGRFIPSQRTINRNMLIGQPIKDVITKYGIDLNKYPAVQVDKKSGTETTLNSRTEIEGNVLDVKPMKDVYGYANMSGGIGTWQGFVEISVGGGTSNKVTKIYMPVDAAIQKSLVGYRPSETNAVYQGN